MKRLKTVPAVLLGIPLLLSGCAEITAAAAESYTAKVEAPLEAGRLPDEKEQAALRDFSLKLFAQAIRPGENTAISAYSALEAMGMTANGMRGDSLTEFENACGIKAETLNQVLAGLRTSLSRENSKFRSLNSIWYRNTGDMKPEEAFLRIAKGYYDAEVFGGAFDDRTLKAINAWVKTGTDGKIPEILDRIGKDDALYLINALSFNGEWDKAYTDKMLHDGVFTDASGNAKHRTFMHGAEAVFLEDKGTIGFMKPYKGGAEAFVALLPPEGASAERYAAELTGERLAAILKGASAEPVLTAMPKFKLSFETDLIDAFKRMGVTAVFDSGKADLSGLGPFGKDLAIGRIVHKTFISVNEKGTEAKGATAVTPTIASAGPGAEPKSVILDRPFVWLILDRKTQMPLFEGVVNEIGE